MTVSPYISLRSGLDFILSDHALDCPRQHPARVFFDSFRLKQLRKLVSKIRYKDWKVVVIDEKKMGWMQIQTIMDDSKGSGLVGNNSRSICLCPEMDNAFITDIALRLIIETEMHEAAEFFRLDGTQAYFPHASGGQPVWSVLSMQHRHPDEIPAS
jgi:hypothetical protein